MVPFHPLFGRMSHWMQLRNLPCEITIYEALILICMHFFKCFLWVFNIVHQIFCLRNILLNIINWELAKTFHFGHLSIAETLYKLLTRNLWSISAEINLADKLPPFFQFFFPDQNDLNKILTYGHKGLPHTQPTHQSPLTVTASKTHCQWGFFSNMFYALNFSISLE